MLSLLRFLTNIYQTPYVEVAESKEIELIETASKNISSCDFLKDSFGVYDNSNGYRFIFPEVI